MITWALVGALTAAPVRVAPVQVSPAPGRTAPAPTAPVSTGRIAPGDSLVGGWTLDRAASGDVRRAIDTVTARMSFFIRPIARARLRGANEVHTHLSITIAAGQIATQVDRAAPIASPASGAPVMWTRENGDVFQLHTVLTGQRLVQTFVGKDGSSRENVFVPGSDGHTLDISVVVSHARLPRPLTYHLVYRRDAADVGR